METKIKNSWKLQKLSRPKLERKYSRPDYFKGTDREKKSSN